MNLVEQIAIYRDRVEAEKRQVLSSQPQPIRSILENLPDDVQLVDYTSNQDGTHLVEAVFMTDDMRRFELQFYPGVRSRDWYVGANGVIPKIDISGQAPEARRCGGR